MRVSKALAAAAVGAATVLTLSGCATGGPRSPSADPDEKATITFLTFQSPNLTKEFWEEQVSEIEKQYPNLTVEIQYSPGLDRQGYAKQLLATGNLPDVIWDVPLQDFAKAGAILPYEDSQLTEIDVPADTGLVDGKRYSLTVGAQAIPLVYYNKDIFESQGISVPGTYDELIDAAETLKAANVSPFLVGGGGRCLHVDHVAGRHHHRRRLRTGP